MMYCIVDIETTGGRYNEEGITEIAIYKFDGQKVVDQFISLINPERPIQPFVVQLTGINQQMLQSAPKFFEIAKRVVEITTDCIFVAHNASFDFRILQTEFRRLGFSFERPTLCTVSLSKKLFPNQPTYKLGKLVRSLGIPLSNRHRAAGDAQATVALFKQLLLKDLDKTVVTASLKQSLNEKTPAKFLNLVADLPNNTGVYFLHKSDGKIIYIGKSNNIKSRVNQHLTGKSQKALKIQLEIAAVTFEETGSEVLALLQEIEEIKHHKPKHNRAFKAPKERLGLEVCENEMGYQFLRLVPFEANQDYLTTFGNLNEAKKTLFKWTETHQLCQRLTNVDPGKGACFHVETGLCLGACVGKEAVEAYNERVLGFIQTLQFPHPDMLIVDKGRAVDEKSVILIENHKYKGYGYFNLNHQINHRSVLNNLITRKETNRDIQKLLLKEVQKKRFQKIIPLNSF